MKHDNTAKNFSVGQRVKYKCYGFSGYGIINYRMFGGYRYIVELPTDSEYLKSIPGCCSSLIGIDARYLTAAPKEEE